MGASTVDQFSLIFNFFGFMPSCLMAPVLLDPKFCGALLSDSGTQLGSQDISKALTKR
jgi:hypothetical protein